MSTVLIVDDELDKLDAYKMVLEDRHVRVVHADTAIEALGMLRHERIDLVLLDIMMPYYPLDDLLAMGIEKIRAAPKANVTTGVRFFQEAHKEFPHVPIIILSWLSEIEIRERAQETEFVMPDNLICFQKGVDSSELVLVEIIRQLRN